MTGSAREILPDACEDMRRQAVPRHADDDECDHWCDGHARQDIWVFVAGGLMVNARSLAQRGFRGGKTAVHARSMAPAGKNTTVSRAAASESGLGAGASDTVNISIVGSGLQGVPSIALAIYGAAHAQQPPIARGELSVPGMPQIRRMLRASIDLERPVPRW